MADHTYTVLILAGGVVKQDREYRAPEETAEEFGRLMQAELSVRPMPCPDVEVHVFAGTDICREPDFTFRRRRTAELVSS